MAVLIAVIIYTVVSLALWFGVGYFPTSKGPDNAFTKWECLICQIIVVAIWFIADNKPPIPALVYVIYAVLSVIATLIGAIRAND